MCCRSQYWVKVRVPELAHGTGFGHVPKTSVHPVLRPVPHSKGCKPLILLTVSLSKKYTQNFKKFNFRQGVPSQTSICDKMGIRMRWDIDFSLKAIPEIRFIT